MLNDGTFFMRLDRVHRNARREYPPEVFPFGDEKIELFAHLSEGQWRVTEKKTGLIFARSATMEEVVAVAKKNLQDMGRDVFIKKTQETLEKINQGLEYNGKEWVNQYEKDDPVDLALKGGADD